MKSSFPPYPQSLIVLVNKVYTQFAKKQNKTPNLLFHPLHNSAEVASLCFLGHGGGRGISI